MTGQPDGRWQTALLALAVGTLTPPPDLKAALMQSALLGRQIDD